MTSGLGFVLGGFGSAFAGWFAVSLAARRLGEPPPSTVRRAGTAATSGVIGALLGIPTGVDPVLAAWCLLTAAVVVLADIDLRQHRLPREISYPAFAIGIVALSGAALAGGEPERIVTALIGALLAVGILGIVVILGGGDLGPGDVRLAPLLGVHLGYLDLVLVPLGLLAGFVLGAIVAVVLLASGRASLQTSIAFGPMLAVGTLVTLAVGPVVIVY